jgi:cytochrome P450
LAEYSGTNMGSNLDGVFEDGVADLHERIATVHDGPRFVKDRHGVTLTRLEDIVAVNKRRDVHSMDPETLVLASMTLGAGRPLIPLMLDGDLHTKYRKLLDPLFAPKQVAKLEPVVRHLCDALIDGFAADGCVDFFAAFCAPLPTQIFLTQLGLPLDDVPFLMWVKDGIIRPSDADHRDQASPRLVEYLEAELRRRATDGPGPDLIGGFLTAEVDGQRLTAEDVIDITFLLVLAGLDTVTSSLSCMVDWLARHPDSRDRLQRQPTLLPAAIEELMRVHTPVVAGARHATADFELDGVRIEKGDNLRLLWAAADMDPEVFPDPTKVDFDRADNRHVAFASGFHRCLGSHLARMELRVAIETLHRRLPDYRPDPDGTPGYRNKTVRCVDPLPLVFTPAAG